MSQPSLPVIIDANSPIPDNHVKLYVTCADQYNRYGDKVVLIDLSHDFQLMGHLHDVLAQSLGGLVKARDVKLIIPGESSPISAADRIRDAIDRIMLIDGVYHLTMLVEEWTPRVYSTNPFEMRREWEMYRPVYKTDDSW